MSRAIAAHYFVKPLCFFGRPGGRRLLRVFALVSSVYSFWLIFDMDHYLPWRVRFFRAAELTLIGHFGLWLATFEWRSRLRFVVAAIFLPTMLGVSILWGQVHTIAAIAVCGGLGMRMLALIKGKASGS